MITWNTSDSDGSVRISLYAGKKRHTMIANAAQNTGSYSWHIPKTMRPGNDYRIHIVSTRNRLQRDFSDDTFAIEHPAIRVTYPNTSYVTWNRGSIYNITWDQDGEPGTAVRIDLYKGNSRKRCITNSAPNTGSYSWVVPIDTGAGNDYKIRICSCHQPRYYDYSDHFFSISEELGDPYIAVADPNGDPTASTAAQCGNSECVFSDTLLPTEGVLTVTCRFQVVAGRVQGIMGKVRACISDVGDSTLTWQTGAGAPSPWTGAPDGRPSGANTSMGQAIYNPATGYFEAVAIYTGLPTSNDAFGPKQVWAQIVDGSQVITQDVQAIEVFYSRLGANNPAAASAGRNWGPNWFY